MQNDILITMDRRKFLSILIFIVVAIVTAIVVFLIVSFWRGDTNNGDGSGFSLFPNRGNNGGVGEQTPDGEGIPDGETPGETGEDRDRLRKLADFPVIAVSGYYRPEKVIVERLRENITVDEAGISQTTQTMEKEAIDVNQLYARYIKQENGAVYTTKIANTLVQKQTTTDVIPYAEDGAIDGSGNNIFYRFYNESTHTIETFLGTINQKIIPPAVCAEPLPGIITADSDPLAITLLQEFLAYNLNANITRDGKLGQGTRTALTTFQSNEGIARTGNADEITIATINNRCLEIIEEKSRQDDPVNLDGIFLTENITDLALSPDKKSVFYIAKRIPETIGVTLDLGTRGFKQILSSPFSEWTASWHKSDSITISTKPAGSVEGFLYTLDTTTGTLQKILDQKRGLMATINPSAQQAFITESTSVGIKSSLLEIKTGKISDTVFSTIPEKCVWAKDAIIIYCAVPDFVNRGTYPDDWYKGKMSFTDSWWSLNTSTGETEQIIDLSREGGEDFDVIMPELDPYELYLLFVNKRTGEPWILEL